MKLPVEPWTWEVLMEAAITKLFETEPYASAISNHHTEKTPQRAVAAFKEYFSGCYIDVKTLLLQALFPAEGYAEMVHVKDIKFHSTCAHHLALISGTAHFAYLPDKYVIGLSKIPRLVEAYAKRPQVQENMSRQIVDAFMQYVEPTGCGVFITADHACMQCRGARAQTSGTDTMVLAGSFLNNPMTRQEFLMSVYRGSK